MSSPASRNAPSPAGGSPPRRNLPTTAPPARGLAAARGGSLYRILTAAAPPIAHAEAALDPTVADKELARLLDVSPGTPIQHLRQTDYDELGQAVMVSDEWHVTSIIELRVYRRGPGPVV